MRLLPDITRRFESFQRALLGNRAKATQLEDNSLLKLYHSIPTFDFSSVFLAQAENQLAITPLQGIMWSDWGRPERVFDSLRRIGRRPLFLKTSKEWRHKRRFSL